MLLGKMWGVCRVSPSAIRFGTASALTVGTNSSDGVTDVRDSTARRNVSSKGFTFCRSSNRPTSSHLPIRRVGVGV
uniref:Putative secreted protein n=1 Tax=Anopheles marajoara TaxID=58244 RepID=A0A2M4CCV3_9DIPT